MSEWKLNHTHNGTRRFYTCDGERAIHSLPIISVTTALGVIDKSGPLVHWATERVIQGVCDLPASQRRHPELSPATLRRKLVDSGAHPTQSLRKAGRRGTGVHLAMERWVETGVVPPADEPEHMGYHRALRQWIRDVQPECFASEVAVGSERHGYAGTFDMLVRIDGRVVIGDLKTSKRHYPSSHFRQLAAYELARREMGHVPEAVDAVVVLLANDGTYTQHWMSEFSSADMQVWGERFRAALRLYRDELTIAAQDRRNKRRNT